MVVGIKKLGYSQKLARSMELTRNGKKITTPTYFPAISGTQHNFTVKGLLEVVAGVSYPRILISAYDFSVSTGSAIDASLRLLKGYGKKDPWLMMDSGIFESSRLDDQEWSFDKYSKVVHDIRSDLYFAFDAYPQAKMTNPEYATATSEGIGRSEGLGAPSDCIPVIHGRSPKQLLYVGKSVIQSLPPKTGVLAVPERDCGSTLVQRAETIIELRKLLDSRGDLLLHILGCGNPVSMALYVYSGADTFDSLDWTEQFLDRSTRGFFRDISHVDVIECACKVCERAIRPKLARALMHNLLFYFDFSVQLQEMVMRGTLRDFLLEFMSKKIIDGIGK